MTISVLNKEILKPKVHSHMKMCSLDPQISSSPFTASIINKRLTS